MDYVFIEKFDWQGNMRAKDCNSFLASVTNMLEKGICTSANIKVVKMGQPDSPSSPRVAHNVSYARLRLAHFSGESKLTNPVNSSTLVGNTIT